LKPAAEGLSYKVLCNLLWRIIVPKIEIDEEVWEALSGRAKPFVDTPNSVLRRVFGLPDDIVQETEAMAPQDGGSNRRRSRRGDLLPETEYFVPILQALSERGGRAPTREVLDAVGEVVRGRLTPRDFERTGNGSEVRWEMRAHFARLRMKERGLLESNSPRGTWAISAHGRRHLAEALAEHVEGTINGH
jgi:hypothetical protein